MAIPRSVFIYELIDPRDQSPKYIGKTVNLKQRLKRHMNDLHSEKKSKKINWLKTLDKLGLEPTMQVIDEVFESEWEFWEKHYISLYKSWGFDLKNGTDGGDGNNRWQEKHTEETKEKIRKALIGKPKSASHRLSLTNLHGSPVLQYSLDGIFIKEFASITLASRSVKCSLAYVSGALREIHPTAKGYVWKYKNASDKVVRNIRRSKKITKEKICQIDKERRLVGIFLDSSFVLSQFNLKTNSSGSLHEACRTKGIKSYKGYHWCYRRDLKGSYSIGDLIEEVVPHSKNKSIKINDKYFSSISLASKSIGVSSTTIKNYCKGDKLYKNIHKIEYGN